MPKILPSDLSADFVKKYMFEVLFVRWNIEFFEKWTQISVFSSQRYLAQLHGDHFQAWPKSFGLKTKTRFILDINIEILETNSKLLQTWPSITVLLPVRWLQLPVSRRFSIKDRCEVRHLKISRFFQQNSPTSSYDILIISKFQLFLHLNVNHYFSSQIMISWFCYKEMKEIQHWFNDIEFWGWGKVKLNPYQFQNYLVR